MKEAQPLRMPRGRTESLRSDSTAPFLLQHRPRPSPSRPFLWVGFTTLIPVLRGHSFLDLVCLALSALEPWGCDLLHAALRAS